MDRELIDRVWACLPREFREEVKKRFLEKDALDPFSTECAVLCRYFGKHNLYASDAEGEEDEMLYVSRKKLQYFYEKLRKVGENHAAFALQSLFGSKCLPDEEKKAMTEERYQYLNSLSLEDYDNKTSADEQRQFCEYQHKHHPDEVIYFQTHSDEEPKPAESEFKVGDKIRIVKGGVFYDRIGEVTDIDFIGSLVYYKTDRSYEWLRESDLEPYTEPNNEDSEFIRAESVKESRIASEESHLRNLSQETANCDKSDTGFIPDARKCGTVYQRRKMNMAAMIAAGILAGSDFMANDCTKEAFDKLAEVSLDCAESIISKTLKDGED